MNKLFASILLSTAALTGMTAHAAGRIATPEQVQSLFEQAEEKSTPYKIKDGLTVKSITIEPQYSRIRYELQYSNVDINVLSSEEAKALAYQETLSLLPLCEENATFIDAGVTFRYFFKDMNDRLISLTDFDSARCQYLHAMVE